MVKDVIKCSRQVTQLTTLKRTAKVHPQFWWNWPKAYVEMSKISRQFGVVQLNLANSIVQGSLALEFNPSLCRGLNIRSQVAWPSALNDSSWGLIGLKDYMHIWGRHTFNIKCKLFHFLYIYWMAVSVLSCAPKRSSKWPCVTRGGNLNHANFIYILDIALWVPSGGAVWGIAYWSSVNKEGNVIKYPKR